MNLGGVARGVLVAAMTAIGLTGCSPPPYPTAVPRALQRDLKLQAEQATADRPVRGYAFSLCYSKMMNTPRDLMDEARLICRNGAPTYYDSDLIWTSCSLQQPVRATFLCTPSSAPPAP